MLAVLRHAGTLLPLAAALVIVPPAPATGGPTAAGPPGLAEVASQAAGGEIVVYILDHQFLPPEELGTIQSEVESIFSEAGVSVRWRPDDSPRRTLAAHELRLIILPSDGTRWFHGPSNVIGIAPHDDSGIGRNCFVFYRQAIWFRMQAVERCRAAIQARTEAEARDTPVDPYLDALAPPECGDYLPSLTARIVARAAAHEMVHILLNKLDHSEVGLMRMSFDINDWLVDEGEPFRLGDEDINALQALFTGS